MGPKMDLGNIRQWKVFKIVHFKLSVDTYLYMKYVANFQTSRYLKIAIYIRFI